MAEAAQHLVETLRKGMRTHEDQADHLAFLAEVAGDASLAAALHNLARMQRVKALQLMGQIAALMVQHGMI